MPVFSLQELMWGELSRKLELARLLFARHGTRLQNDPQIRALLALLHQRQEAVRVAMALTGLPEFCLACAVRSRTGGCCSRAMAEENDALLLLVNMLAGITVIYREGDGSECCFLGDSGCVLAYKPFFCLNYLCQGITSSGRDLGDLLVATGLLLQGQYALEQALLSWIREQGREFFSCTGPV